MVGKVIELRKDTEYRVVSVVLEKKDTDEMIMTFMD